jgi:cytochrome P450
VLQIRDAMRDPLAFMDEMASRGDVVTLRENRTYLVTHPDGVRHVLQDNHLNYRKGARYVRAVEAIFGRGLATSEGELWRRQRRLVQPAFHRLHHAVYAEAIVETTRERLARWDRVAGSGEPLELRAELRDLTLTILLRTIFGRISRGETAELGEACLALHDELDLVAVFNPVRLPTWVPTPRRARIARARRTIDAFITSAIEERRGAAPGARPDVLSLLLSARDPDTGAPMPDALLRDEVVTMLFAGHDTVTQTLTWALFFVASHPEVEDRLVAEVLSALGPRDPGADDLERLPFLNGVVQETLRVASPIWGMMRVAIDADAILGWAIPAGAGVIVSPYVLHHSAALWPEPTRFDPDRFAPGRAEGRHRFAYLPFGAGPHLCVGNGFAMLEVPLVLALLLRRFRLRLVPGQTIRPLARISVQPDRPVRVTLEVRDEAAPPQAGGGRAGASGPASRAGDEDARP